MMKKLVFSLFLCLGMFTGFSTAQSADWQITLYDEAASLLHIISADGVEQSITLPLASTGERFVPRQVSSDLKYAAGIIRYDEPPQIVPAIADLSTGTCCQIINIPRQQFEEFYIRFTNFLPGTSQFALSINTIDFDNPASLAGWLSVIDATDASIISNITFADFYPYVTTFKADGIRYLEAPAGATEWFPYDYYTIWNPSDNIITDTSDEFSVGFRGDILETTGEAVMGVFDDSFPIPYSEYMIPPGNTVQYFSEIVGESPGFFGQPEGGTTVYFDANHMETSPQWVLNGDAFIVYSQFQGNVNTVDIVKRGENPVTVSTPGMAFLTGTPDGWLMYDEEQGILYHFTQDDAGFSGHELARFRADIELLSEPEMSVSVTGDFLEYTLSQPGFPIGGASCNGGLPSRLRIGERGWVLPGPANNFRTEPALSGELIGQLQGSVVFDVVSGPVCADGLTWWQVRDTYSNTGWTAESNSSEYWVAPLPQ